METPSDLAQNALAADAEIAILFGVLQVGQEGLETAEAFARGTAGIQVAGPKRGDDGHAAAGAGDGNVKASVAAAFHNRAEDGGVEVSIGVLAVGQAEVIRSISSP